MGTAYIIGFSIYFYKRHRRKKLEAEALAIGGTVPKKKKKPEEKVIIPPDPAIIQGQRVPGENAFDVASVPQRFAKSMPLDMKLGEGEGSAKPTPESPELHHAATLPTSVPSLDPPSSTPLVNWEATGSKS